MGRHSKRTGKVTQLNTVTHHKQIGQDPNETFGYMGDGETHQFTRSLKTARQQYREIIEKEKDNKWR